MSRARKLEIEGALAALDAERLAIHRTYMEELAAAGADEPARLAANERNIVARQALHDRRAPLSRELRELESSLAADRDAIRAHASQPGSSVARGQVQERLEPARAFRVLEEVLQDSRNWSTLAAALDARDRLLVLVQRALRALPLSVRR